MASPYARLWNYDAVLHGAPQLRALDDAYWTPAEIAGLWTHTLSGLQQLNSAGWPTYNTSETLQHHLSDFMGQLRSLHAAQGGWKADNLKGLKTAARVLVEGIAKVVYSTETEHAGKPRPFRYPDLSELVRDPVMTASSSNLVGAVDVVRACSNPGPHSNAVPTAASQPSNLFNDAVILCYYVLFVCRRFDAWWSGFWGKPTASSQPPPQTFRPPPPPPVRPPVTPPPPPPPFRPPPTPPQQQPRPHSQQQHVRPQSQPRPRPQPYQPSRPQSGATTRPPLQPQCRPQSGAPTRPPPKPHYQPHSGPHSRPPTQPQFRPQSGPPSRPPPPQPQLRPQSQPRARPQSQHSSRPPSGSAQSRPYSGSSSRPQPQPHFSPQPQPRQRPPSARQATAYDDGFGGNIDIRSLMALMGSTFDLGKP